MSAKLLSIKLKGFIGRTFRKQKTVVRFTGLVTFLGLGYLLSDDLFVIPRFFRVLSTTLSLLYDYRSYDALPDNEKSEFHRSHACYLLYRLRREQGLYWALGQYVPGVPCQSIPTEYSRVLNLLNEVPYDKPHKLPALRKLIGRELSLNSLESIDEIPIHTSPFSQIFHATDKDGQEYAMKIRSPNVVRRAKNDLLIVQFCLNLVQFFYPQNDVSFLFHQFRVSTLEELDFRSSVQNMVAFNIANRDSFVIVPEPVEQLCSHNVMTTKFVKGKKLSASSLPISRSNILTALNDSYARQIFETGITVAAPRLKDIVLTKNDLGQYQLVLFKNQFYHLDAKFRRHWNKLWLAFLCQDRERSELQTTLLSPYAKHLFMTSHNDNYSSLIRIMSSQPHPFYKLDSSEEALESFWMDAETNHLILNLIELDYKLKEINDYFLDSPVGWYQSVLGATLFTTAAQSHSENSDVLDIAGEFVQYSYLTIQLYFNALFALLLRGG